MDIYRRLWTRVGGRPWTYILRDTWVRGELFWILGLLAIGAGLGHAFSMMTTVRVLGLLALGALLGHLFWGTPYVPDQKE